MSENLRMGLTLLTLLMLPSLVGACTADGGEDGDVNDARGAVADSEQEALDGHTDAGGDADADADADADPDPDDGAPSPDSVADTGMGSWAVPAPGALFVGDGSRPATLIVPSDYDASVDLPAVVLLGGYWWFSWELDEWLTLSNNVDGSQFVLVLPDGTIDSEGPPSGTRRRPAAILTGWAWMTSPI